MTQKKIRQSNLELLRVVAMMMIIILHYVGGAGCLTAPAGTANYYFTHIMESLCICSVNCFVLISAYFMVDKKSTSVMRQVRLLIDVFFWGAVGLLCAWVFFGQSFTLSTFIQKTVPFIAGGRWFVESYIILMLLAPFINKVISQLNKHNYQILLAIVLLLFSVWPSFLPHPPLNDYGYGFVHFIQLYLIVGYMKWHMPKWPSKTLCMAGYVGSCALVFLFAMIGWGQEYGYNFIFVITAALCLFGFFKQLTLQSKIINVLAVCAFDVFLIHTDSFFLPLIYNNVFHADTAFLGELPLYMLSMLLCAPVFYLIGALLSWAKRLLFKYTIDKLLDRLPSLTYTVD